MTGNRLGCEDKNECEWNPCGLGGSCSNLDKGRGWMCQCPQGFRCNNCSCDGDIVGSQIDPYLTFSVPAVAIIIACIIAQSSKNTKKKSSFDNSMKQVPSLSGPPPTSFIISRFLFNLSLHSSTFFVLTSPFSSLGSRRRGLL